MSGITLAQLTQIERTPEKKYIMLQLLREAKVMQRLPFENVSGLTVQAMWWEQLPDGGTFRSLNEGYTSAENGQLGDGTEAVFAFGGDVTYDRVLELIKNVVGDPVKMQVDARLKVIGLNWNNQFINGDVAADPKGFNGIKKRIAGMPARQTIWAAGSTSAPFDPTASAANARSFMNMFNLAWRRTNGGNVDDILCNEDFIVGFSRVLALMQSSGNFLATTKDQFGREELTYRGATFTDMGLLKDQATEVISNTEVAGDGGADSMSVYFVSYNKDQGIYGIQLNPLKAYQPLGTGEMESKPSKLWRIDWWNGLASFGKYGMTRLRNIERLADWTE